MSNSCKTRIESWILDIADPNFRIPSIEPDLEETKLITDTSNNDLNKKIVSLTVEGAPVHDTTNIRGDGEVTFDNGDYFRGEFYGSVGNREGKLVKVTQDGAITYGTWRSGLLEVKP